MGQSSGLVCTECGGAGPEGSEHLDWWWGCFRGRGHLDSGGHTTEGFPIGKREPFGKFISINFYNKEGVFAQSCLALCNPMDCRGPLSMGFSRQEYWSGLPFPSPMIRRVYL